MSDGLVKEIISSLPKFIKKKSVTEALNIPNLSTLFNQLPKKDPFFYLESGLKGKRILLLGEKWSIKAWSDHIEFKIGSESKELTLPNINYAEIINLCEEWLQGQNKCLLGINLMYEAGWNQESRRGNHKTSTVPDLIISCPKEIIIQRPNKIAESFRESTSPSLLCISHKKHSPHYAKKCSLKNNLTRNQYIDKITTVKKHIRKGDSFQVNFSQEFQCLGELDFLSWAESIFTTEAGKYSCLIYQESFKILSISPERLVAKQGEELITRPIAGTHPKKESVDLTKYLSSFKTNTKELAEHNMIIDLERNDMGKISVPGSVDITEYLCVEELPHLYHLVSEIRSKLDENIGMGDIVNAMFPGGTITGCPKLETMHILDELENIDRKAYTGSVGYLGESTMDLNILIRTALIVDDCVSMRFGGGIVWDSDPEKEYEESLTKARGLIMSLVAGGAEFDSDNRSLRQFFS